MNKTNTKTLPKGWRWVRLGEVCEQDRTIIEAGSLQASRLPYLGLEHVEANTGRILREAGSAGDEGGKSTTFAFSIKHVLFGKLRPYLNKVALPNHAGRCTTELIPLLPGRLMTREFLAWVLRRPETVHAAMKDKTGSRMPRADMRELMRLEVPLPPLAEQKRIAAILKEQLAAVDRARADAETQLESIKALPAALLRRAFCGEL